MFVVALVLAVLVGMALGLLGGGGSLMTLPILRYALGLPAHEAIATSLLVVGTTSVAALVPHALRGNVRWRTGLLFGLAGMAGAYPAGRLARYVPDAVLLGGFALIMFATAFAMLRRSRSASDGAGSPRAPRELPVLKVLLEGLAVGAVTGLIGAGGGFLVVPALALLGGLPMPLAIGTSLLVIGMKSFAGFAGFAGHTPIDWTIAGWITAAALLGSVAGARLATRAAPEKLRAGFGWFVVLMAFFLLAQELPALWGGSSSSLLAAGIALAGTLVLGFISVSVRFTGARKGAGEVWPRVGTKRVTTSHVSVRPAAVQAGGKS